MTLADSLYRYLLLPPVKALTRDDAEVAHEWFVRAMELCVRRSSLLPGAAIENERLKQTLMDGLEFPNPFGTAAGMDKNATIYPALAKLTGAGHVEVGGVTLNGQPGNERPRLVRVDANNLINAMGFPNDGVDAIAQRIATLPPPQIPISVQITLNKGTSEDEAPAAYGALIRKFKDVKRERRLPDYFTINVSSPNTPGLRALQDPEHLTRILEQATTALDEQNRSRRRLLIKLAPDIEEATIEAVIELIEQFDIGGLVLTNTTTARPVSTKFDSRPGGFSGSDLYGRSSRLVRFVAKYLTADRVLVAVGGIDTPDRAYEMLQYADLIDGYTGLVLKSPLLFRGIAKSVVARMVADGVKDLAELRAGQRPVKA